MGILPGVIVPVFIEFTAIHSDIGCYYKEIIVIFLYLSILCYVKVRIAQNSMSKNVLKVHLDRKNRKSLYGVLCE